MYLYAVILQDACKNSTLHVTKPIHICIVEKVVIRHVYLTNCMMYKKDIHVFVLCRF